jgi:hypothetical protein
MYVLAVGRIPLLQMSWAVRYAHAVEPQIAMGSERQIEDLAKVLAEDLGSSPDAGIATKDVLVGKAADLLGIPGEVENLIGEGLAWAFASQKPWEQVLPTTEDVGKFLGADTDSKSFLAGQLLGIPDAADLSHLAKGADKFAGLAATIGGLWGKARQTTKLPEGTKEAEFAKAMSQQENRLEGLAKGAEQDSARRAKVYDYTPEEIEKARKIDKRDVFVESGGWWKDVDGKWRFEINDDAMVVDWKRLEKSSDQPVLPGVENSEGSIKGSREV